MDAAHNARDADESSENEERDGKFFVIGENASGQSKHKRGVAGWEGSCVVENQVMNG